jgi:hypothetical protein
MKDENRKMKIKIQAALAVVFLMVSLPLLVWGFWPPQRETRVVPLLPAVGMPNLPEAHSISLEFSPTMRAGDSQIIKMTLSADAAASTGQDFYAQNEVIAEARLDMPSAFVRPADSVRTTMADGGSATFYWEVHPSGEGLTSGTAWLYLQLTPKAGGGTTRQPVSAQLVEVRSQSLWKRTGGQARAIGVIGALVGLFLGFPFLAKARLFHRRASVRSS